MTGSLVRTDGTSAGTAIITSRWPSDHLYSAIAVRGGFLAGLEGDGGFELAHLGADGTGATTVADLAPGNGSSDPRSFAPLGQGDDVVFAAGGQSLFGATWFVADPTGTHVRELTGLQGEPMQGAPPATIEGVTYLVNRVGDDALLYRTDGTPQGTVLLRHFPGGRFGPPRQLTGFAGEVWFSAQDGVHGEELWRTDGTPEMRLERITVAGKVVELR